MKEEKKKSENAVSASFIKGAIALVFLIIGYETALFVQKAAVSRVVANRDVPDTVYVADPEVVSSILAETSAEVPASSSSAGSDNGKSHSVAISRKKADHSDSARKLSSVPAAKRKVESFRFDPNTVSIEDLQRLGFTQKQAESIDNYRLKGGRFRRPDDFAKSFVVSDSIFQRLRPYINIPKIDINSADSVHLISLPGIGGYFASKIIEYRARLGGYSYKEQLMDIYHFDREKYDGLQDLIKVGPAKAFPLWTADAETLKSHPYIGSYRTAKGIILYRENNPLEKLSVDGLVQAGVISSDQGAKLSRCRLEPATR